MAKEKSNASCVEVVNTAVSHIRNESPGRAILQNRVVGIILIKFILLYFDLFICYV